MASGDLGSFSIRVVDEDGNGVSGASVTVHYASLLAGYYSESTDSDGWAEFDIESAPPWGSLVSKVAVDGRWVDEDGFTPEDGDTFSYARP
jgi:hypothetical protein